MHILLQRGVKARDNPRQSGDRLVVSACGLLTLKDWVRHIELVFLCSLTAVLGEALARGLDFVAGGHGL
ncbi:hypothetical protein Nepgr_027580 [Nepenthes gracilis]|uniref:Uncharacterized protein n=1 Tax=Nepenthes gracilis TaxID=150966 RepID=A0AAD3Y1C1_NEPGR|nr:hypothetical protein Nepgr_027580 [Nepenthes gracilis]